MVNSTLNTVEADPRGQNGKSTYDRLLKGNLVESSKNRYFVHSKILRSDCRIIIGIDEVQHYIRCYNDGECPRNKFTSRNCGILRTVFDFVRGAVESEAGSNF